jgi:hypothetical protein
MPDLFTSLQKQDLGHLRILAGMWGLELNANETDAALKELCASLLDPDLLAEILEALGTEARNALEALVTKNGRIPWAEFTRRFGDIREMGAGKRDRENPHLNPATTAEVLFYRALLARAFFNTANGPQEFAYIPDELLELFHHREHPGPTGSVGRLPREHRESKEGISVDSVLSVVKPEPLGRPASPGEKAHALPANDFILDDATTLLAALRLGIDPPEIGVPQQVLESFLRAAKIILKSGPKPEKVKLFLEAPRHDALQMLADAWLESESINELRQLPGLVFEGEWQNQPVVTREFLINLLEAVPEGKWWSLPAFLRDLKARYPDFQRPAGDYDSWFIKRESDGEYLRGFAHWDQVDGALVKYFITNILFWLGQVDLAAQEEGAEPTAFRLSSFLAGIEERGKITASSSGRILVERSAPRAVRYLVARFCEWEDTKGEEYRYLITPSSLKKAGEQGLKVEHLLSLLAKHAAGGIPPVLVKALKRWEANGTEARVQTQVVLRVSRPEVLEELRKSKAARFLGELLGPTTAVIKAGAQSKVLAALAELGLLAEEDKHS